MKAVMSSFREVRSSDIGRDSSYSGREGKRQKAEGKRKARRDERRFSLFPFAFFLLPCFSDAAVQARLQRSLLPADWGARVSGAEVSAGAGAAAGGADRRGRRFRGAAAGRRCR